MNENNSSERRQVDDAGIRLAPTPLDGAATKRMPAVVQEFVLAPRLDYAGEEDERREEVSTASDYQPKERDAGRRWKRSVRTRNFLSGTIMLIASAAALLPFILAAADVTEVVKTEQFIRADVGLLAVKAALTAENAAQVGK